MQTIIRLIEKIVEFLNAFFDGLFGGKFQKSRQKWPYRKKDYLLSIAERKFYDILRPIAEKNNYLLFAKVRLEDLLWIPSGVEDRWSLRGRIKSRHIDFVLCDKQNIKPLLAIELDDSSHDSSDRMKRDDFIDDVFHDAGLPILHQRAKRFYNVDELSQKINDQIRKQIL